MQEQNTHHNCGFHIFPPPMLNFDMLFLRSLYHRMEETGYYSKEHHGVHIVVFRRCMRRLLDMFDSELQYNFLANGGHRHATYISWDDIRKASYTEKLPEIELRTAERIFMVLDGQTNSLLGMIWGIIVLGCIIASVIIIIVQSLQDDVCLNAIGDARCEGTSLFCSIIFTVDYFGKLLSSPWSRLAIFNNEWLIEHAVVDASDPHAPVPTQSTPWIRTWYFISTPMHIVDLLSVLPFVLQELAAKSHIPLAVLRSLRLLRLFRVFKFGKFSGMLLVLGDTMMRSMQSIAVLVIYIMIVSLLAGAVINQFEGDAADSGAIDEVREDFSDVPRSLWWVITRMVTMQHSLPYAKEIPETWESALIMACVGTFKAVIFVLPIGQIAAAFKDSWAHQQTRARLSHEVELQKNLTLGFEWVQDRLSPVARFELRRSENGRNLGAGEEGEGCFGSLPLPLLSAQAVDCTLSAALHGAMADRSIFAWGDPELRFRVTWEPYGSSRPKERMPHGLLKLLPVEGKGFSARQDILWDCLLSVPVKVQGDDAVLQRATGLSDCGGPCPSWPASAELAFEIAWLDDARPAKPSKEAPTEEEAFRQQVLQKLEVQSKRILSLERKLQEA